MLHLGQHALNPLKSTLWSHTERLMRIDLSRSRRGSGPLFPSGAVKSSLPPIGFHSAQLDPEKEAQAFDGRCLNQTACHFYPCMNESSQVSTVIKTNKNCSVTMESGTSSAPSGFQMKQISYACPASAITATAAFCAALLIRRAFQKHKRTLASLPRGQITGLQDRSAANGQFWSAGNRLTGHLWCGQKAWIESN